jgi:hypothetical protein
MDVSFFLIETLFKTVIPILSGKGMNVYTRMIEIYNINEIVSIFILNNMIMNANSKYRPLTMNETFRETISTATSMKWNSYSQFKNKNNNDYDDLSI